VNVGAGAGAPRAALALAALFGALALAPEPAWHPCAAPAGGTSEDEVACGGGGALGDPARLLFGLRIDANRAERRALEALPGIGPRLAGAWIRERERASLCTVQDLDRVPGIGPSRMRALAPWLEFAPEPACSAGRTGR
jgi:competence protein ComEA